MNMKKLTGLLLVGAITIFSMAGCGTTTDANKNNQDSVKQEATKAPENNATDEAVTVTMMVSGTAAENDFELEQLPELVNEAFPNVTLEVTKLPDDQYYTTLKTQLNSGKCADIILVQPMYAGTNAVIDLAAAGFLEPLTNLNCVKLAGAGAESFTYDGNVYAIPQGVSMLGTYYNADMFSTYNIAVPTNWDEFLNACEILKTNGITPIVMGDKDMYVMQFGLYQLAANTVYGKNANYDSQLRTGETSFTDENTWDKTLTMYCELYDKGYIGANSLGIGAAQAMQQFIDGEAAMIFDGNFNFSGITAEGAAGNFTRGYFPLPGNAAGEQIYAAVAPGAGPAIYSGSENKEICKEILELWFDGESNIYKSFADCGKYVVTYGYGADSIDPMFQQFLDLYNEGNAFYWCNQAWPSGVAEEMEAGLSEYIGGIGTQPGDIAQRMQDKFNELIN